MNPECDELNEKMKSDSHTHTAKGSFACKRGRPDIQTAMAFLTTRVTEPDEDDWKKSLRSMSHLKDTMHSSLTLEADDLRSQRSDAACAVHHDMKGHTGAGLTSGKGSAHSESVKQKINGKSGTEIEIDWF